MTPTPAKRRGAQSGNGEALLKVGAKESSLLPEEALEYCMPPEACSIKETRCNS